jgi:hypothetical protein
MIDQFDHILGEQCMQVLPDGFLRRTLKHLREIQNDVEHVARVCDLYEFTLDFNAITFELMTALFILLIEIYVENSDE